MQQDLQYVQYVYLNCGERYECMVDLRSYTHKLSSCETAQVVCITAKINHTFISFSAVQIYDLSYIHLQDLQ